VTEIHGRPTTPAPPSAEERPLRLARTAVVVLLPVVVGLGFLHYAWQRLPWDSWVPDRPHVAYLFNLSTEANVSTWFDVAVLLTAGFSHALAGWLALRSGHPSARYWFVTAVFCVLLSVDDGAVLHEQLDGLGRRLGGGSGLTYAAWVVPGVVLGGLVVTAIVVLAVRVATVPRRLLLGGIASFFTGALLLESLGNATLEERGFSREYAYYMVTEELLESTGAVLLMAAGLAAVRVIRRGPELVVSFRA
jgi:hypothetical protein